MHTVCSGVFGHAVDDELITASPTPGILKKINMARDHKDINPFSLDQFDSLLSEVDQHYKLFFVTAFNTGARLGELCALKWSDVNLVDNKISISKTAKDQNIRESTKTYLKREVDISHELLSVLIELKRTDKKICFKLGIEQKMVFHRKGKLLSQQTLLRKLKKACDKLGIGNHTIHDIRHTFASLLLSRGANVVYVSKMLGHSSPKITLDRYSHYMPSENEGMINLLDSDKKGGYKRVLNDDAT
jgi:integrase